MMAISDQTDPAYVALLGLAESFRQVNNINECVRCLKAIFQLSPTPPVVARTHLQLGVILTKVQAADQARQHLEQAWYVSQPLPGIDEVKFEAASLLAQAYIQASNPQGAVATPLRPSGIAALKQMAWAAVDALAAAGIV